MEQRSISDIKRLSTPLGWPSNPEDGSIAIHLVFATLKDEIMPPEGGPESEAMVQRMRFVRHCVEVVMTSVGQLMSKTNDRAKDVYSPIYEDNMGTYTRWLRFMARETVWVYEDHGAESAVTFGPAFVAEALETMYNHGTERLREFMRGSPDVVDLMLFLWMSRNADGKHMYIQYGLYGSEGEGQSCPLLRMFSSFLNNAISRKLLEQTIASFTPQAHREFINGSLARLDEWKASRAKTNTSPPPMDTLIIVTLTQSFLNLPVFAKAYVKSSSALMLSRR